MINEALHFDILHLVANVYIYHDGQNHQRLSQENLWSPVYHKDFGLCYTMDIKKGGNLSILNEPLILSFEFYPPAPYPLSTFCANHVKALIHHNEDLPTSSKFNELYHDVLIYPGYVYEYTIRKSNFDMESTWHTPCGQLFPEECKQIQVQKTIEERYNCR